MNYYNMNYNVITTKFNKHISHTRTCTCAHTVPANDNLPLSIAITKLNFIMLTSLFSPLFYHQDMITKFYSSVLPVFEFY